MKNIVGNKDTELIVNNGKVLNNFDIQGTLTAANFPDADKSFIFEQQVPASVWMCFTEGVIKELVPCDEKAFKMYRF
jgi:hypothetical protein